MEIISTKNSYRAWPLLIAAALTVAAQPAFAAADRHGPVDLAGADGGHLRVQAIDIDVMRIWAKPSADFQRAPSNALVTSEVAAAPLTVDESASDTLTAKTQGLAVTIDRNTLAFTVKAGDVSLIDGASVSWKSGSNGWNLAYHLQPDEHLLGLGQDNMNGGRLDRRGTQRDLWTGQQINSGNVTANYPVPLMISVDGKGHAFGLFIDDVHRMHFDLGASDPNTLRCDAEGGEADFYVINGPTLAKVVERYTALTGRPPLPPLWALGYWQSKCVFWQWQDLDEAANQLTKRGFPYDVMVIDYSWPDKLNDYTWDKRWSGDGYTPESKIADYAKRGVKIVMSNSGPMVVKDSPTYPSGWKAGVFATDGHGNPVEAGYYHGELLDFTSPAMDDWLLPQVAPLTRSGVAGWWLDLSEPEGDSPQTTYHGGDTASIHNQYSLLESRWYENAQLKTAPNQRPWILTRCASAGIQRLHLSVWTGDTHSDYPTLKAHSPEMLNSGLSGLTWWTCDSGGFLSGFYKNDQYGAHARLYERWMQFSVFSPITRAHHAGPVLPYEFGPEAEKGCQHYLQLRYKLLPYIYSYAWEASQTGLPITRPLALEYPSDSGSLNSNGSEYLFGRELLVAPVVDEDVTSRPVYFPPGKWIDWDTGATFAGGATHVVDAPQHRIPVLVRAGAIIPMAPPMHNTSEKPWDLITVEIYPSGHSTFTMYKDDGHSFDYQSGAYTVTQFTCDAGGHGVKTSITESNKRYTPHNYLLHLHLGRKPSTVSIDGVDAKAGWTWDSTTHIVTVGVESGSSTKHTVDVK